MRSGMHMVADAARLKSKPVLIDKSTGPGTSNPRSRPEGALIADAKVKSNADRLHQCLGHAHPHSIRELIASGAVTGLHLGKGAEFSYCEASALGKSVRRPFPSKATPVHASAKRPLRLVHTDVCGPFRSKTPGGGQYIVTFLDEYTKIWQQSSL